jgi:protein TonB
VHERLGPQAARGWTPTRGEGATAGEPAQYRRSPSGPSSKGNAGVMQAASAPGTFGCRCTRYTQRCTTTTRPISMRILFLCLLLGLPLGGWAQGVSPKTPPDASSTGAPVLVPVLAPALAYAEQLPAFAGGAPALRRYLAAALVYPPAARLRALSGTVVVQFVVDEQGRVVDAAVARTSDPVFAAEATRVVYLMPWWTPGRDQGRPVRVRCTLPIVFTYKRGG